MPPSGNLHEIPIVKKKSIEYIYMFLMLMWAQRTGPWWDLYAANSLYTLIWIVFNFHVYTKYCKGINTKPFLVFSAIMLTIYCIHCVKNGGIIHFDYPIIYDFIVCMMGFHILKDYFVVYYEKVVTDLSIIALIVWGAAVVIPGVMVPIMKTISVLPDGYIINSQFFVVGLSNQFELGIRRNLGFAWEPGRYASFLVLAIFFNFLINKMKVKGNTHLYVLVAALLSTLSTTGYMAFGLLVLFFLYNRGGRTRAFAIVLMYLALPSLLSLSFLSEKIHRLMFDIELNETIHQIEYFTNLHASTDYTPQRGMGLLLEWQNIIHDPIFGYGSSNLSYVGRYLFPGINVVLSNGILQVFAKYGIVVGAFFYFYLFKSSIELGKFWNVSGSFFFLLLFFAINVSYNFFSGFTLLFVFYYLFKKYSRIKYGKCTSKDNCSTSNI